MIDLEGACLDPLLHWPFRVLWITCFWSTEFTIPPNLFSDITYVYRRTMRVHLEVDLVSSMFIWLYFTVAAKSLHSVAFAFWEWIRKGHFSQGGLQTSGAIGQNASQVWLPLYKTHPALFTATRLVDMHREQGNCVYLDMQGHGRPENPQRCLQRGLCPYCDYVHVIPVPLNNRSCRDQTCSSSRAPFFLQRHMISHFLPQLITNDIVLKLCVIGHWSPPPPMGTVSNKIYVLQ